LNDPASPPEGTPPRLPTLAPDAHKGDAGRVLLLAGSATMPGAAVLAARAAQRAGAGLVAVGCLDRELLTVIPAAAPEAVLVDLAVREDGSEGALPADLRARLSNRRDHVRVAGPGLGNTARTRNLLERLLDLDDACPLVLDADGLNVLGDRPELLAERAGSGPLILTPHAGEAGRLLGRGIPREAEGRAAAAEELAGRSGAIVCLKGRGTVITDGDRTLVNASGNAGMATAGSGDVLAGILGAFLATAEADTAWTAFDAAVAGVWVHGRSGDMAAEGVGLRALIASDLIDHLPLALRTTG